MVSDDAEEPYKSTKTSFMVEVKKSATSPLQMDVKWKFFVWSFIQMNLTNTSFNQK